MKHTLKELVRVKNFLLAGTTVTIVEEKVSRTGGSGLSLAGVFCVRILSNDLFLVTLSYLCSLLGCLSEPFQKSQGGVGLRSHLPCSPEIGSVLQILSWPVMPTPVESPLPAKKGKGDKKEKEKEKEKGKKQKAEEAAKEKVRPAWVTSEQGGECGPVLLTTVHSWPCPQDKKGLKKKKERPKELRQDPPVLRLLGSGLVYLEPLLAGDPAVTTVCNFGVIRTMESDRLTHARVQRGPLVLPFRLCLPSSFLMDSLLGQAGMG